MLPVWSRFLAVLSHDIHVRGFAPRRMPKPLRMAWCSMSSACLSAVYVLSNSSSANQLYSEWSSGFNLICPMSPLKLAKYIISNRVRAFNIINIGKYKEGVADLHAHGESLINLALQPSNNILTVIDVSARQLINIRQEILGGRPLGQKDFFDTIKDMMDEGTGGNDLLAMGGGFAVVGYFVHVCSIAKRLLRIAWLLKKVCRNSCKNTNAARKGMSDGRRWRGSVGAAARLGQVVATTGGGTPPSCCHRRRPASRCRRSAGSCAHPRTTRCTTRR
jgi:hypothetical protein